MYLIFHNMARPLQDLCFKVVKFGAHVIPLTQLPGLSVRRPAGIPTMMPPLFLICSPSSESRHPHPCQVPSDMSL